MTDSALALAIAAELAALRGGATAADAKAAAQAVYEAAAAAADKARQVGLTRIIRDGAAYSVDTVQLPRSLLYETMVFAEGGGSMDLYCRRYETLETARSGHARTVLEFWPGDKTSPAPVEF